MGVTIKRSPAYPSLPLSDAIARAKTFYKHEGKHETLVPTAASHWKYGPKSSGGLLTVASLKAYGLMADKGNGPERKVFLTPLGLNIVQDERIVSPDRDAAIKKSALIPKIMNELWSRYQTDLPSHDTISHFLKVEREFNENAAADVIKIYRQNLEFAKLGEEAGGGQQSEFEEGDGEQREVGGTADDSTVEFPSVNLRPPPAVARAETRILPIKAGEEEIANIRVSKTTTIRLVATGPYSRQSIESLVKQLELGLTLGNYDDHEPPDSEGAN